MKYYLYDKGNNVLTLTEEVENAIKLEDVNLTNISDELVIASDASEYDILIALSHLSEIEETTGDSIDEFLVNSVNTIKLRLGKDAVEVPYSLFDKYKEKGYLPVKRDYKNYPLVIDTVKNTESILFSCEESEIEKYEALGFTIYKFYE